MQLAVNIAREAVDRFSSQGSNQGLSQGLSQGSRQQPGRQIRVAGVLPPAGDSYQVQTVSSLEIAQPSLEEVCIAHIQNQINK